MDPFQAQNALHKIRKHGRPQVNLRLDLLLGRPLVSSGSQRSVEPTFTGAWILNLNERMS